MMPIKISDEYAYEQFCDSNYNKYNYDSADVWNDDDDDDDDDDYESL